jgi:hypothetical protein
MNVGQGLDAYRRAWEERDAEAAAALFDEHATYRSNIFEAPHEGRGMLQVRRGVMEMTAPRAELSPSRPREGTGNDGKRWVPLRRKRPAHGLRRLLTCTLAPDS